MAMMEGMVKTPFGEVSKKTALLVGGGLAALLLIMYSRYKKNSAASAAATAGANTGIDPATGYAYGTPEDAAALAAQSSYVTPTGGGGGNTPTNTGFVSNGQWAQAAEQFMQAEGLVADPSALAAALGKYITGQPVSDIDMSLIDQAIAFQGMPPIAGPSGYPPSINRAPVPPPTTTTPPPTNTPPSEISPTWQNVYKGQVVDDWINASGKDWKTLTDLNPGLAGNVSKSTNPRLRVFLYNTAYRVR